MTTSTEHLKVRSPLLAETEIERGTKRPGAGQNVADDPGVHAIRGVLWSVTVARVMLVPVFLVAALRLQDTVAQGLDPGTLRSGLVLTLAIIATSDMLDGWLARRYGLATQAGAIADALADKLAQVAIVAFFTFNGGATFASLPLWLFALVVGRDVLIGGGWLVLRAGGVPFPVVHGVHGRAATAGIFAILLWLTIGIESDGFWALVMLTAALIWVSLASYLAGAWTAVRQARLGGEPSHGKEVDP